MAIFPYRCQQCGAEDEDMRPIGTAAASRVCPECGGLMRQLLGVGMAIHSDATPNKRHEVRATNRRERRWDRDMPAYKRMRDHGLQPPSLEGAAHLEDRAADQLDIDYQRLLSKASKDKQRRSLRNRVVEATEALTGAPPKVAS